MDSKEHDRFTLTLMNFFYLLSKAKVIVRETCEGRWTTWKPHCVTRSCKSSLAVKKSSALEQNCLAISRNYIHPDGEITTSWWVRKCGREEKHLILWQLILMTSFPTITTSNPSSFRELLKTILSYRVALKFEPTLSARFSIMWTYLNFLITVI